MFSSRRFDICLPAFTSSCSMHASAVAHMFTCLKACICMHAVSCVWCFSNVCKHVPVHNECDLSVFLAVACLHVSLIAGFLDFLSACLLACMEICLLVCLCAYSNAMFSSLRILVCMLGRMLELLVFKMIAFAWVCVLARGSLQFRVELPCVAHSCTPMFFFLCGSSDCMLSCQPG